MSENYIFWICIIVSIIGMGVLVGIIYFGKAMLRDNLTGIISDLFHRWNERSPSRIYDFGQQLAHTHSEYLQRRNEFWTSYGQTVIAVLVALILCILLLTKSISAEAGLPILSAISGFAIAKGVAGSKSANLPQDKNPENNKG